MEVRRMMIGKIHPDVDSIKETNLWHSYEVLINCLVVQSYENNLNRQKKGQEF
jgi:hypothetical protein